MSATTTLDRPGGPEKAAAITPAPAEKKLERLNTASVKRHLEPEEIFDWESIGDGQIIPDDLLSTTPLTDVHLTAEQKAQLSRDEVSAMLSAGIRFEAVLMAGFSYLLATTPNLRDVRHVYALHEIGEETRHSRAFLRFIEATGSECENPLDRGPVAWVRNKVMKLLISQPALLNVFVLAGEEIPDLIQKRASEHPDTDPLLAAVNKYHRQEEARHLAYARLTLPELAETTGRIERWRIRRTAPFGINALFEGMLHPGIYSAVGLPGFKTWWRANRTGRRVQLRREAIRPVLQQVIDAGFVDEHKVPRGWRHVAGVTKRNEPLPTLDPEADELPGADHPAITSNA
jgi:hypothetical protein